MYEGFYNLTALPFQLTPDHRFFFSSDVHKKAMAHLDFGLSQGEGFIVITGEVGSGKTTLIRQLLSQLDDAANFVTANVTSSKLEGDDIVRSAAHGFGIETDGRDKASILRDLESFLVDAHARGYRSVLIVDEAQNLSVSALEELRMFANFQHEHAAVLQVIMVGQPEFRGTLGMPQFDQLRQRILASYHLGPINEQETREYVTHRLRSVNWDNDPEIAPDAFKEIFSFSEGIPRRINTLCARVLLYGFIEERHHIDGEDVRQVASDLEAERLAVVDAAAAAPGAGESGEGHPAETAVAPAAVAGVGSSAGPVVSGVQLSAAAGAEFLALAEAINGRLAALEKRVERNDRLLRIMSVALGNSALRE